MSSDAIRAGHQLATARAAIPGRSTDERMTFLDAIKATGIVMVVAVHVLSRVQLGPAMQEGLLFLVGTVAVPLFLVADGFLFAHRWTGQAHFPYGDYIRRSIQRLLLPWAACSLLYMIVRAAIEVSGFRPETVLIGKDLGGLAKVLYLSELSHHMYFLLSLFLVRLGTVVVQPLLRYSGAVWFGILSMYIALYVSNDPKRWFFTGADPALLALWGGQFYLLGIVFNKWHEKVKTTAGWLGIVGLGLTVVGWWLLPASSSFLTQLCYLIGTYAGLMALADATGWRFTMGKDTMGIYLLHAPYVVWLVVTVLSSLVPANHVGTVIVASVATVSISWGITKIMGKFPLGRLLLGHRLSREPRVAIDKCCDVQT